MIFGFPFIFLGSHNHFLRWFKIDVIRGGFRLRFIPREHYNGWYRILVDREPQGLPVYAPAGAITEFTGILIDDDTHYISICPQGDWAASDIDCTPQYDLFLLGIADRLHISTTTHPTLEAYADGDQLTNWDLQGLQRFRNCYPSPFRPTWGLLDITLVSSGDGAPWDNGSVSVAVGATTVTNNTGTFPSYAEGMYIQFEGQDRWYKIDGYTDATHITIDGGYRGTDTFHGTYQLENLHTLRLKSRNTNVAVGSRIGDGTITLHAPDNTEYGLTGTVDLAYTADLPLNGGATLVARFPKSLKVHYKQEEFATSDFPRVPQATVRDDGIKNLFQYRSRELDAGIYYVVVHQLSETDVEGVSAQGGGAEATIVAQPEPAGVPYVVNVESDSTVGHINIEFPLSETAGVSYNIYDSGDTEVLDIEGNPSQIITAEEVAGDPQALTLDYSGESNFTGKRYVLVRAVKDGIEEQSVNILVMTFINGVYQPPAPPVPTMSTFTTTGRILAVKANISLLDMEQTPTSLELFLVAESAEIDLDNPDGIAASGVLAGLNKAININGTAGADGLYTFYMRTRASDGTASPLSLLYGPVELSDEAMDDPAEIVVIAGV